MDGEYDVKGVKDDERARTTTWNTLESFDDCTVLWVETRALRFDRKNGKVKAVDAEELVSPPEQAWEIVLKKLRKIAQQSGGAGLAEIDIEDDQRCQPWANGRGQ